jgi:hypothetical protein
MVALTFSVQGDIRTHPLRRQSAEKDTCREIFIGICLNDYIGIGVKVLGWDILES